MFTEGSVTHMVQEHRDNWEIDYNLDIPEADDAPQVFNYGHIILDLPNGGEVLVTGYQLDDDFLIYSNVCESCGEFHEVGWNPDALDSPAWFDAIVASAHEEWEILSDDARMEKIERIYRAITLSKILFTTFEDEVQ